MYTGETRKRQGQVPGNESSFVQAQLEHTQPARFRPRALVEHDAANCNRVVADVLQPILL